MWEKDFTTYTWRDHNINSRYQAFYKVDPPQYVIIDWHRVNPEEYEIGTDLPERALLRLPVEAVRALLEEVADTKMIDQILADKTYVKEVEDRHLDIIESLIEKVKGVK